MKNFKEHNMKKSENEIKEMDHYKNQMNDYETKKKHLQE